MKIYEIATGYTPVPAQMGAATEIVVEELTKAFLEIGEDVEILDISATDRSKNNLPITEIRVPSVFTKKDVSLGIMHKVKRVVYSVALALKLKKLLKKAQGKIVLHFHNQYNMFFFLKLVPEKLRKKATLAYTVHSYIWGTDWEEIKDTVKTNYFQEVYCVQNADLVLVLNDKTTQHFTNHLGVDKNRIVKIINGVNTDTYSPLDAETVENLKKSANLAGKKMIFQVGSVCERKNQLGTVEMLADYLKNNENVVYMYAGGIIDPEYKNKIDTLAKEKGILSQVQYVGELAPGNQLNQYYNMADCSVFTSNLESFGLVIIEAISAGTPVIMGNKLMFDLKSGYTIYKNQQEFIEQVNTAINTPKQTARCHEVLQSFNWVAVAKNHISLFN